MNLQNCRHSTLDPPKTAEPQIHSLPLSFPFSLSLAVIFPCDLGHALYPPGPVSNKLFFKSLMVIAKVHLAIRGSNPATTLPLVWEMSVRAQRVPQAFLTDNITINRLRLTQNTRTLIKF